jgi:DNA end-binding protein Ku
MKSIWKGSIAFGLVNIPINVYPASEEHTLEFHILHKKDLSPIRFARICKADNQEVPYSEIVKGFEYEKGEYVVIEDEDFKRADVKKTSTIEIQHFTDIDQIDPIYFEKPYFLEPDKKSAKAYMLLHEALMKSKKIAIANFVFRHREHIGAILPFQGGLQLIQMRYHVEIRPFETLEVPKEKIRAAELTMALSFVDQLSKPFEPEKFHDTYVESLMAVIQQKLQGKKRARAPKEKKISYEARDLMHLLQESMKNAVVRNEHKKGKTPSKKAITTRKERRKSS